MKLTDEQLQAARASAAKPLTVSYWTGWEEARAGWCIYLYYEGLLESTLLVGPFNKREEMEAAMAATTSRMQEVTE